MPRIFPQAASALLLMLQLGASLDAAPRSRTHGHSVPSKPAHTVKKTAPGPGKAAMAATAAYPWHLALTDQRGKRFDIADARGKTLVVSFFFTSCGSACPMQTSRLVKVERLLSDSLRERSRFVSISIDPQHDSSMVLANYADVFRADTRHWRFAATRDTAALHRFATAMGAGIKAGENGAADHAMAVTLIDAQGRVAQRYVGDKLDESRLAAEIADVDRLFGKAEP